MMGKYLVEGTGTEKDVHQGIKFIKIAAQDGHSVRATSYLDYFYSSDTTRTWLNLVKQNEELMRQVMMSMTSIQ